MGEPSKIHYIFKEAQEKTVLNVASCVWERLNYMLKDLFSYGFYQYYMMVYIFPQRMKLISSFFKRNIYIKNCFAIFG